jgi:hypothetical protein
MEFTESFISAKNIAEKLPADKWFEEAKTVAYRTAQSRVVISIENNHSMDILNIFDDEDQVSSDKEFAADVSTVLDFLSPRDEAIIAKLLLQRLIHWESGLDLSREFPNDFRSKIAGNLLREMSLALIDAKKIRALQLNNQE